MAEQKRKVARIAKQEKPRCISVQFNGKALDMFEAYVWHYLRFNMKRGGILYGTEDGRGNVVVEAIYEPRQDGTEATLSLEWHTEGVKQADYVAEQLGMRKVGWIFSQFKIKGDYTLSNAELAQMADIQRDMGPTAVTAVVTLSEDEDGEEVVSCNTFQVSEQYCRLKRDGWVSQMPSATSSVTKFCNPKVPHDTAPVLVGEENVGEVSNDYFIVPVEHVRHNHGSLKTDFPIENRLTRQGLAELNLHMLWTEGDPDWERLADFHLLLFLSKHANFDRGNDMEVLVDAISRQAEIPDAFMAIINSLADMKL